MDKLAPTQEQIKEFWEWCGVRFENDIDGGRTWYDKEQGLRHFGFPELDLNNLFKYAVPKIVYIITFDYAECAWACLLSGCWGAPSEYESNSKDPALALFWALWQVKEVEGVT